MLREGFNIEELAGHMWKVNKNECDILDSFAFVRYYVDKKVSMYSTEELERLVGWCCNVTLVDIQ